MQVRGLENFVAGEGLLEPLQARPAHAPAAADPAAVDPAAVGRPLPGRDVTTIYRSARAEPA
jgi:hypothetical protein